MTETTCQVCPRLDSLWRDRHYAIKQVEAFAVREGADWLVITVVTRY